MFKVNNNFVFRFSNYRKLSNAGGIFTVINMRGEKSKYFG